MRFRIKSGQSARRFVFDRTPAPAKPPQPSAPRAADLDNPYGRYYGTARKREDLRRRGSKGTESGLRSVAGCLHFPCEGKENRSPAEAL